MGLSKGKGDNMKEMEKYLKERLETLEKEQDMYLEEMTASYDEKGYYREMYFKALYKKIEIQEALIKLYTIEKGETNDTQERD